MTATPPLVSVCLPTYNGDRHLNAALDSIRRQTYPNLEIICCDDGSSDSTIARLRQFAATSPHPCVLDEAPTRRGMVANWNACLHRARGIYLKFLFQDDWLEPDCIAELVRLAETDPALGLVFAPRRLAWADGAETIPELQEVAEICADVHAHWSNLRSRQPGTDLLADDRLFDSPINKFGEPTAVLLRASAVAAVGGFDPQLRQLVDVELWWRLCTRFGVGFVARPLATFRLHPQQQTLRNFREGGFDAEQLWWKLANDPAFPATLRLRAGIGWLEMQDWRDEAAIARAGERWASWLALTDVATVERLWERGVGWALRALGAVSRAGAPPSVGEPGLAAWVELLWNPLWNPQVMGTETAADWRAHLRELPQRLRGEYVKRLLSQRPPWRALGEAQRYGRRLAALATAIAGELRSHPEDWREVAIAYFQTASLVPARATGKLNPSLAAAHGEIIEGVLTQYGHELDWQPPAPSGKRGILLATVPPLSWLAQLPDSVMVYGFAPLDGARNWVTLPRDLRGQVRRLREGLLDELAIAVDLAGDRGAIPLLARHRLAQVQWCWDGCWDGCWDIVLDESSFSEPHERLTSPLAPLLTLLLKPSVTPPDRRQIAALRARLDIPDEATVLLCETTPDWLTAERRRCWAKILQGLPNSVLVLLQTHSASGSVLQLSSRDRLNETAAQFGIDRRRFLVFDPLPGDRALPLFALADLYLDVGLDAAAGRRSASYWTAAQVQTCPVVCGGIRGNFGENAAFEGSLDGLKGKAERSRVNATTQNADLEPTAIARHEANCIDIAIQFGKNPGLRQALLTKVLAAMGAIA